MNPRRRCPKRRVRQLRKLPDWLNRMLTEEDDDDDFEEISCGAVDDQAKSK